jgi:hypothetical protein
MAANLNPIFPKAPLFGWGTLTAANAATDGTGAVTTLVTAGADGARIDRLRLTPLGSNVATVCRLFVNNGNTNATPANNTLLKELTLPLTTASAVAALADVEIDLDLPLPAGYKLNATLGTAVAAGWAATLIGGSY